MKKLVLVLLIFCSCSNAKYEKIGQEIVDGKVSACKDGHRGRISELPKIWVQTETQTVEVNIPFSLEGRWKVGDSCLLIIEKYKENKE